MNMGARSEAASSLSRDEIAAVSQAPQLQRSGDNRPLISAEQLLLSSLPKRDADGEASVAMRGVGEEVWQVRPNVRITAGRKFTVGLREVIVGQGAQTKFAGLQLGSE